MLDQWGAGGGGRGTETTKGFRKWKLYYIECYQQTQVTDMMN